LFPTGMLIWLVQSNVAGFFFFYHSLSQVTSLSSIHFSTFVGDAVQAA